MTTTLLEPLKRRNFLERLKPLLRGQLKDEITEMVGDEIVGDDARAPFPRAARVRETVKWVRASGRRRIVAKGRRGRDGHSHCQPANDH